MFMSHHGKNGRLLFGTDLKVKRLSLCHWLKYLGANCDRGFIRLAGQTFGNQSQLCVLLFLFKSTLENFYMPQIHKLFLTQKI